MTKYLITGATGFIGSYLIDHLTDDSVKSSAIRLLITPRGNKDIFVKRGFDVVTGDVRDKKCVNKSVENVDVIYHLAVKTGDRKSNYQDLKDVNVEGTRNLVNAAVRSKVKKFIFFSSTAVYGLPQHRGNIRYINEKGERNYSDAYGRTKYEAENLIMNAAKETSFKYIIVRPVHVFGKNDEGMIGKFIRLIKRGYFIYLGDGKNKIDFVYVKDLVKIVRELEKSKIANQDFIITPSKHLTLNKVVEIISEEMKVDIPKIHIPLLFALLAGHIVEFISEVIGARAFATPETVKALSSDFYFNASKLGRYGLKSMYTFEEALHEVISYN